MKRVKIDSSQSASNNQGLKVKVKAHPQGLNFCEEDLHTNTWEDPVC